jgi:putative inorganic carbon (HCO3(-)) transporter
MFTGVVVLGSAFSLLAPFMVKWETHKVTFLPDWLYQRFTILVSDTVNPSVLAGSLVLLIPFPLAILLFTWPTLSKKYRGFLLVSSILMILVLILTQSRGGWLTFFILLVILPVFRWRHGWIGLIIFGCGFIILNYQFGFKHVLDLLIASKTLQSLDGRIEVWSRAIYMIKDFSWTGIGFGLFGDVADQMYPFIQFPPGTIVHAHNLFLQIALDLGIPGLIAWLGTWLLVLYAGWRLYRIGCHRKDQWVVGLGVAILCSQVALGVFGISDAPNWGMIRTVPIVWAVWGLAMAGLYVFKDKKLTLNKLRI